MNNEMGIFGPESGKIPTSIPVTKSKSAENTEKKGKLT